MRPVSRRNSPRATDYPDYKDAKADLISRLGGGWIEGNHIASYCSYCERKIDTMLAVEHIEPKDGLYGMPHLTGRWTNFLLACANCNSTKNDKQVDLAQLYFPDRDNTFLAFEYLPNGTVQPRSLPHLGSHSIMASDTLALTGIAKPQRGTSDEHGRLIADDRASQRRQVWIQAESSKTDFEAEPQNHALISQIIKTALNAGFFSVWMTVFELFPEVRNRLINAFSGTRESGCFDPVSTASITPAPNPDRLPHGGKV